MDPIGILRGNTSSNNYVIFRGHVNFQGCILIKYPKSCQKPNNIYERKPWENTILPSISIHTINKKQSFIPNPPHPHPPPTKKKKNKHSLLKLTHFVISPSLFHQFVQFLFLKASKAAKNVATGLADSVHSLQWCHCVGCGCWAAGKRVKRQHERNTHGALGLVTLGELGGLTRWFDEGGGYKIGTQILQQL